MRDRIGTLKSLFPTIFTPQGDGNAVQYLPVPTTFFGIPDNIYPARGRKLSNHHALQPLSRYSRQYLPRKGTETSSMEMETSKE